MANVPAIIYGRSYVLIYIDIRIHDLRFFCFFSDKYLNLVAALDMI